MLPRPKFLQTSAATTGSSSENKLGKVRQRAHQEGIWALHFYISIPRNVTPCLFKSDCHDEFPLDQLIQRILSQCPDFVHPIEREDVERVDREDLEHLHVSLSKIINCPKHLLDPFTRQVCQEFPKAHLKRFKWVVSWCRVIVRFSGLKIYQNETKTRSFLALDLDRKSTQSLLPMVAFVDRMVRAFGWDTFYNVLSAPLNPISPQTFMHVLLGGRVIID